MVSILKLSGDVRICVDLMGLNKAVRREVYPMPVADESISLLNASKIFSKLDANSGFWQIHLDEESRKLITFLIPFNRFCFNRLPFAISCAPEIVARAMSRLLEGVENVLCHMDNILINGKDVASHDKSLKLVLFRLEQTGLTLNKSKCEIRKSQVMFLGHTLDKNEARFDAGKVSSIHDFPTPTCKTEVKRLHSMLNQSLCFTSQR